MPPKRPPRGLSVSAPDEPTIHTLEPLMEAVREGVESAGWELSGLQKTTSHQFSGRWEGESTRSAYLFFHMAPGPEHAGIDVYLDETSQGLTGNLALVLDLRPLGQLGGARAALRALGLLSGAALPTGLRTPLTLRLRLEDVGDDPVDAEAEVRFKLRIPRRTIRKGPAAVRALAAESVSAFEAILIDPRLVPYAAT
jgi:hypothetical protein